MQVLLVDDHTLFRQGLKFLLEDLDESTVFVEASTCEQALELEHGDEVDLVLLDYHLPGLQGLQALQEMNDKYSSAAVVVLSSEDNPQVIRETIDNGAAGFVPKSSTPEVLVAALGLILAGGIYLPPHALTQTTPVSNSHGGGVADKAAGAAEKLSARQLEVLLRVVQGKPNKVVARELNISEGTVKTHLSAAFRALGVKNRTEAVYVAAKLGLSQAEKE